MEFNISQTLKEYIEKENLSLSELGKKTNISRNYLKKYLEGTLPRMATAVKIANYFKCSLDYLFSLTDCNKSPKKPLKIDCTNFFSKYKKLLDQNKITHFSLCKKLGITETSLSLFKKGAIPSTFTLLLIVDYFKTSIDELICEK